MAAMHETEHKSFDSPEETRAFPHGRAEILNVGDRLRSDGWCSSPAGAGQTT